MMNNKLILGFLATAALAACGDNLKATDGGQHVDAGSGSGSDIDATPSFPAAPVLGNQIDRLGRPAINTALNAPFVTNAAAKEAQKVAYNEASDPATWAMTQLATNVSIKKEFQKNLAIFDAVDKGLAGVSPNGCGNSALYTGPAGPMSYATLATVLADDRLYVDTSKTTCNFYLSVEVEVATGGQIQHTECGGRTLTHDVIDTSYSLLGAGLSGFDMNTFAPKIKDNVDAHTDVTTTFPFLGAPHT